MGGKPRDWLYWLLLLIAIGTAISGIVQLLSPKFVLTMVGAATTSDVSYFFAIIGMFMALFGALVINALLDVADHPVAILWAAMQKLFAAVVVWVGVRQGIFGPMALGIAGFDLITSVLMFVYWRRIRDVWSTRA